MSFVGTSWHNRPLFLYFVVIALFFEGLAVKIIHGKATRYRYYETRDKPLTNQLGKQLDHARPDSLHYLEWGKFGNSMRNTGIDGEELGTILRGGVV